MDSGGGGSGSDSSFGNMNGRTGAKRRFSTMTEPHGTGSPPSLFSFDHRPRYDPRYDIEQAARRRRLQLPIPHTPTHVPGDGLDFRRPVMSPNGRIPSGNSLESMDSQTETIDLTDDSHEGFPQETTSQALGVPSAAANAASSRTQRLPRYDRDIIDIASSDDEDMARDRPRDMPPRPSGQTNRSVRTMPNLRLPVTDDIELTGSHSISNSQSRQHSPIVRDARSVTPYPAGSGIIDLTEENDDDVVLVDSRTLPGINGSHPTMAAGVGMRDMVNTSYPGRGLSYWAGMLHQTFSHGRLTQRLMAHYGPPQGEAEDGSGATRQSVRQREFRDAARDHARALRQRAPHHGADAGAAFVEPPLALHFMPGMMNYETTGFDLGLGAPAPRQQTPKYEPPPEPEEGFTRNPSEDEQVVCPNCGDELALGVNALKRQVWVVKHCGHAYCGECVDKRLRPTNRQGKVDKASSKGKQRAVEPSFPAPFKRCVVEGCGKGAGKNMMIHVYLGN